MKVLPFASDSDERIAALGRLRLTCTVIGSIALAGSLSSIAGRLFFANDFGFWTMRLRFQITASAFRSEPSWNLTPSRSLKISLLPEISQLLASIGSTAY